jgi:2-methylisocitrate lyase-like PEP mutase family enzyme
VDRATLRDRAQRLQSLHQTGDLLVLMNAWDAGSARIFASAGYPAIGTTSAGIAFSLGRPDGEQLSRAALIEATARIAAAVEVPVTADVETGYGATETDVAETIEAVLAAGAVGVNLEDAAPEGSSALRDMDEQCRRLRAARVAADAAEIPLFINARTDACLLQVGPPEKRPALVLERLGAYADAGADGLFVPGLADAAEIARVVKGVELPLNLLASAATPPVEELRRLGVARLSVGSGPARAALDLTRRIAREVRERGSYKLLTAHALSYDEANRLLS